ncbi:hypothetical protein ACHAPU_008210 [Fusarium lateritium]
MAVTTSDYVDVLVVGAGPVGLMMATCLAKCGIKTRIVDKLGTKLKKRIKIFKTFIDPCSDLQRPSRWSPMTNPGNLRLFGFAHRTLIEATHIYKIQMNKVVTEEALVSPYNPWYQSLLAGFSSPMSD